MKKKSFNLSGVMQSKITWAVVAELLILLVCFIIRPDFFSIKYQPATGMLYGSLIDILNRSAEITIIAMGMTLVIALGGTDLSVGSLVALSGALALKFLRWDVLVYNTPGDYTVKPFILVILVPLAVCTLMLAFFRLAGFAFGQVQPKKTLFWLQFGIFMSLTVLADSRSMGRQIVFFAAGMMLALADFILLKKLREKTLAETLAEETKPAANDGGIEKL